MVPNFYFLIFYPKEKIGRIMEGKRPLCHLVLAWRPFLKQQYTAISKNVVGRKGKSLQAKIGPQGNVGCLKSVFRSQTISPLNQSLILFVIYNEPYLSFQFLKKHKVKVRFSRSAFLLILIFESNFVKLISKEK